MHNRTQLATLIALVSTKGSVGTTTIIQLSAYLQHLGYRCLLIDADGQQTLSKFYDYPNVDLNNTFFGFREFFFEDNITDTVHQTHLDGIDIIANNDPDNTILVQLMQTPSAQYKLAGLINQLKPQYDFIFIDTEGKYDGSISNVQNMVLMSRPDIILSMAQPRVIFANEIDRTIQLYDDTLRDLQNIGLNHVPELVFFINSYDPTLKISDLVLDDLLKGFKEFEQVRLLNTIIPFKRAFYDNYYKDRLFMHEHKDSGVNEDFRTANVIKRFAEELFPAVLKPTPNAEVNACV